MCLYYIIRELSVLERCPYQRGIRIREVSVLERYIYLRVREVSVLERYPC